jgi:hypothetical protein
MADPYPKPVMLQKKTPPPGLPAAISVEGTRKISKFPSIPCITGACEEDYLDPSK